jgi:L-threonylcarbamoyladenylate synthase
LSADPNQVSRAVEALRRGELVVFPTETFYGIGCRAENPEAVARVVAAKRRRSGNPFPVIVADRTQAESLCKQIPAWATRLMDAFWPGPLTIVLPARPGLPAEVGGSGEIGIRISPHPVAAELAKRAGPIVATSANLSGGGEADSAERIDPALVESVRVVVDGGTTPGGRPSTVVAFRSGKIEVIREGAIAKDKILEALRTLGAPS